MGVCVEQGFDRLIPARAGKTRGHLADTASDWAHPRAGGENAQAIAPAPTPGGSSPRGRGKLKFIYVVIYVVGLIPARAGKTRECYSRGHDVRAHPRAGGENQAGKSILICVAGASPRGRGKLTCVDDDLKVARLIPARAGKTRGYRSHWMSWGAHPRAGGENHVSIGLAVSLHGSSPRGRGKHQKDSLVQRLRRLIPARAGKTSTTSASDSTRRAHPRAGGENDDDHTHIPSVAGSSPRGRGKPELSGYATKGDGLIPARAGKTCQVATLACKSRAHPRAGGENAVNTKAINGQTGSSPRGRGKHDRVACCVLRYGLIPARAGKTNGSGVPALAARAHPRAGGENG